MIPILAWSCVAVAFIGMVAGMIRPPARGAGSWLSCLFLIGATGFLLADHLPLAFFTGIGVWLGALVTERRGSRLRFRSGAAGWMVGFGVGLWWTFWR